MTTEITLTLEDVLAAALAESGRPPAEEVRERLIYDLYRDSALSMGTAARLLGMDLLSFLRESGRRGIPYGPTTAEELDQDLRNIDRFLK